MPSVINEHTQYLDASGTPLANGKVYIGTRNLNPVSNTITIYSDRDLTTSISNPQTLDAAGRTTNKIWVPGRYSIQVDNSADVQQYQELDAGSEGETGVTKLTNVAGTNTITAEGTPTAVTSLTDAQTYVLVAANANTGAATLQIDLTSAKTIKKNHDQDLVAGDIEQDQVMSVVYNATDDVFELISSLGNPFVNQAPVVANHIRMGNMSIIDGASNISAFDVSANVTENTFETIGPTGSGATNIWAALDNVPSAARGIILGVEIRIFGGTTATGSAVYGAPNGVTAVVAGLELASYESDANADDTVFFQAICPCDSSQIFQLTYSDVSSGTPGTTDIEIEYQGFVVD